MTFEKPIQRPFRKRVAQNFDSSKTDRDIFSSD